MVRLGAVLLSCMLLAACGGEEPGLTEVLLSVDSMGSAREAKLVRIQINAVVLEVPSESWPIELVVEPGRANKPSFHATAWALGPGGTVLGAAMGESAFTKHKRTELKLMLDPGLNAGKPPDVNTDVKPGENVTQPDLDASTAPNEGGTPGEVDAGANLDSGLADSGDADAATCTGNHCPARCADANTGDCTCMESAGRTYLFCPTAQNWGAARAVCRALDMDLVIIESDAENAFIAGNVGNAGGWIGASDKGANPSNSSPFCPGTCNKGGDEGTWKWVAPTSNQERGVTFCEASMSSATCTAKDGAYVSWAPNEPSNSGGCTALTFTCATGEDCAQIRSDGFWDDKACTATAPFICESY